jgi:hypothetical protein
MSDSAPRKTAQADATQTDAKQAKPKASPAKTSSAKASTEKSNTENATTADASAGQSGTAEPQAAAAGTEQAAAADGDGKPDMDEVKRKFREALDKKRESHADSATGGRNTGKIHGAHGSEDHRRTFRRKSG